MVSAFDRIVVAVPDMPGAAAEYRQLLGATPIAFTSSGKEHAAWVALPNTVIELVQCDVDQASVRGIVFSSASADIVAAPVVNSRKLDIAIGDGSATTRFRREHPEAQSCSLQVDHLVLRTADAAGCIELFGRQLGIRLALDKTVPEWGGRMLFFRAGKLTLEVIESDRDRQGGDSFWGIAFQCRDIEQTAARLARRGVDLSDIRQGRKPDTRVATIRSHCLGLPTLLIEPPAYSPLFNATL